MRPLTTAVNSSVDDDIITKNTKDLKFNDNQLDNNTSIPKAVSTVGSSSNRTRGIPLRDVIPKYVRLKFCNNDDNEAIQSDNELDYNTYKPENDPDLTQYIKPYYYGPNGNYDFTTKEMEQYTPKVFNEIVYNMLHTYRSRSTPSVKRAHHAWWIRMKQLHILQEKYDTAIKIKNNNNNNHISNQDNIKRIENQLLQFKRRKYHMLIDEYASDDGTSIDYYSTECYFSIKAIRQSAIYHYALPPDQELPMALSSSSSNDNPEQTVDHYNNNSIQPAQSFDQEQLNVPMSLRKFKHDMDNNNNNNNKTDPIRTYDIFELQYYDAMYTKTWKTLTNLKDVLYYIKAERAIPIYVPKEYHKYVIEDDPDHWGRYRYDTMMMINDDNQQLRTLDPLQIGDKNISNQERGRRIAAWIRQHPVPFGKQ